MKLKKFNIFNSQLTTVTLETSWLKILFFNIGERHWCIWFRGYPLRWSKIIMSRWLIMIPIRFVKKIEVGNGVVVRNGNPSLLSLSKFANPGVRENTNAACIWHVSDVCGENRVSFYFCLVLSLYRLPLLFGWNSCFSTLSLWERSDLHLRGFSIT